MGDFSNYKPTFSEEPKGIFKEDSNLVSLNVGTDAFVTEREMNEMQWLQIERIANVVKNMTKSGVLTIDNSSNLLHCHPIINNDEEHLNSFELEPFDTVMNGFITHHENYDVNNEYNKNLRIQLANPPEADIRHDFVFIEFWFQELKEHDTVSKFGGLYNDKIDYDIIDERIAEETSRRIQLKWKISVYQDYRNECTYGFLDNDKKIVSAIHPLSGVNILAGKYSFEKTEDENIFRAGEGFESKQIMNTIDGYVYAMPLFLIKRINNAGFNSIVNPNGAINYKDEESVSDRPDKKFANIIYKDQITDLRNLATLSVAQYNKIYISLEEYYTKETILKNKIKQLNEYIEQLYHITNVQKPCLYNKDIYGIDMYSMTVLTGGAVYDDINNEIIYRKRKIYVNKNLQGKDYAVIPTFIDFDIWEKASVGDFYVDKKSKYMNFYNTGARDISLLLHTLYIDNKNVYSGTAKFNGLEGAIINMPFAMDSARYFIHICPLNNNNGYTGSIYVKFREKQVIVYNTGINTNSKGELDNTRDNDFQWTVIDMQSTEWKNMHYKCETLNSVEGHIIKSTAMGDKYSLILGTPIATSEGIIDYDAGDIYADISEENQLTIYNTGSSNMSIQAIILNEVPYETYYDGTAIPINVNVPEIINS